MESACQTIRTLAAERGVASHDLAQMADVSQTTMWGIMHGCVTPQRRIVARISEVLGQPVSTAPAVNQRPFMLRLTNTAERQPARPAPAAKQQQPFRVHDAIRLIAREFEMPYDAILDAVMRAYTAHLKESEKRRKEEAETKKGVEA